MKTSFDCAWCGKPLVPYRPAVRMVRMPKYRELAVHLLGCEPCQQAVSVDGPHRMCTAGQVLMAEVCRAAPHAS